MFSVPMAEITFETVEDFCQQQIEEGVRLDYKGDFPKDLAKLLAAFANTYGGLILIGVDDRDRKPVLPIRGIENKRGLAEQVTSIGLQCVYPPVFPEARVYEFPSVVGGVADRAVVVVRVHQSDQTPHAIENKTQVYLRVDSQSQPFEMATIGQIEWLRERRRDAAKLRERLQRLMASHAASLCRPTGAGGANAPMSEHGLVRDIIRATPLFPGSAGGVMASAASLLSMKGELSFPFQTANAPGIGFTTRQVEGGVAAFANSDSVARYFEVNEYGLMRYERVDTNARFFFDTFAGVLWQVLRHALDFYEAQGFFGLFDLELRLTGLSRREVGGTAWRSVDDRISVSRRATVDGYRENGLSAVTEMLSRVRWAFNLPGLNAEMVKRYL